MVKKEPSTEKTKLMLSSIKNKIRKTKILLKLKEQLRKNQKKARKLRKNKQKQTGEGPIKPKTIEDMRVVQQIYTEPFQIQDGQIQDEFTPILKGGQTKILLTTCRKPSERLTSFTKELQSIVPFSEYRQRRDYKVGEIQQYCINRSYTALLILNQTNKKPQGMWVISLPEGPTAHFKVSNTWYRKQIPNHGNPTKYLPELILKNFDSQLGTRISRQFASLFPQNPEYRGRNVVTLKNQRDFLFFRHHRYMFNQDGTKVRMQEVGPRMTLKLRSLQKGLFNNEDPEYEFLWHPRMQVSRKRFFI